MDNCEHLLAACSETVARLLGCDWSGRGIFLVNVPIGVAIVAVTAWKAEESKSPHPAPPDWAGFALLTAGLVSLVCGLIRAAMTANIFRRSHRS